MGAAGEPRFHRRVFLGILGAGGTSRPILDQGFFDTSRPTAGGFSDCFYARLGLEYGAHLSEQHRRDIAASVQSAVEDIVVRFAGEGENLCLAGGLMLNAPLVSALESSGRYKKVWVQPAANNAGTSLGCAFYAWHQIYRNTQRYPLENLFLGLSYDREEIKQVLENCKLRFSYLTTDEVVIDTAVRRLNDNQIVAWFQGRMEFGSRALGNRSIFASPLNPYSTETSTFTSNAASSSVSSPRQSLKSWRPTTLTALKARASSLPSAASNRNTARLSRPRCSAATASASIPSAAPTIRSVGNSYKPAGRVSGLPVLYNTSFNLFGERLVNDPRAAVRSFYASGIDTMIAGNFLLDK